MNRLWWLAAVCSTHLWGALIVQSGSGAGASTARDNFRIDLGGGTTAGANGSFGGIRREINWDGVPDASSSPNNLPANFFNVNSPRGVVFSTPGTGFQVSANAGVAPVEFDNIDPSYSATFNAFSPQRLFTAIGSNVVDVTFFIPGTSVPALVYGFGAMFTDVDVANTTSIQLFDGSNNSLGTFFAPASAGNGNLSFLGISDNTQVPVIARVRITSGNAALGSGVIDCGSCVATLNELVVMDDFLYSEPSAIPEPAVGILAAAACAACLLIRARRSSL